MRRRRRILWKNLRKRLWASILRNRRSNSISISKSRIIRINLIQRKRPNQIHQKKAQNLSRSTGSYKDDSSNREGSSSKSESNKSNEEKVYTGKVYGEGTSKYNPDSNKHSTVIDADFSEVTVSSVANSDTRQIGQNYIAALLEDKHKR